MGAVVHADHGDGLRAGLIAGIEQCGDLADIALRHGRAVLQISSDGWQRLALPVDQAVAFFGDRERRHLEGGVFKNGFEAAEFRVILAVENIRSGNAANDRLVDAAVCVQRNEQAVVVVRPVAFFDDFVVEAFHGDDAGVHGSGVQQPLHRVALERTENVPGAEVYPARGFKGFRDHFLPVEGRQGIAFALPCGAVLQAGFIEFKHFVLLYRVGQQCQDLSISIVKPFAVDCKLFSRAGTHILPVLPNAV